MYTDIHLVQFNNLREASTLQESNSNLSYLQVFVAWKYLTAKRGMLDTGEASLQWSALYHCLLFRASTSLGKMLSQFTEKSLQLCWDSFRRKLLFLLTWTLVCHVRQTFHRSSLQKQNGKSYFSNEASVIILLLTIPLLHQAQCL